MRVKVRKGKDSLVEGISVVIDGEDYLLDAKPRVISQGAALVIYKREGVEPPFEVFKAQEDGSLLATRDPRIILLVLRYRLWLAGREDLDPREVEHDEVAAQAEFERLRDVHGHWLARPYGYN